MTSQSTERLIASLTEHYEHLRNWAFAPRGKRFISLSFGKGGSDNPVSGRYRWSVNSYNWRDAWEFEVGTRFVGARDELPAGFAARKHGMLHLEARWLSPDLDWRQRFTL